MLPSVIYGNAGFGTATGSAFATARVGGYLAMALTTLGDVPPEQLWYALKNNAISVVTGQPPGTYTTCVSISRLALCFWSNRIQNRNLLAQPFPKTK